MFENKVLRKIFGAKKDKITGEWRKLHNAELHALYSSPNIIRSLKSRRDRLFGTVVSTSDCHPRGPGFDSRLYPRNFSGSIGSGTEPTQPREDNWVAT